MDYWLELRKLISVHFAIYAPKRVHSFYELKFHLIVFGSTKDLFLKHATSTKRKCTLQWLNICLFISSNANNLLLCTFDVILQCFLKTLESGVKYRSVE